MLEISRKQKIVRNFPFCFSDTPPKVPKFKDYFDFSYKFSNLELSRSSQNAKAQPQSLNII